MMSNYYNYYLFGNNSRVTAYQRPILERNSTGKYVKELQMSLNELNYLAGVVDGVFGQMTEAAVKNFQTDYKLPVTGIVDEVVWDTIDNALIEEPTSKFPTIKKGDNNVYVKSLQLKLMNLGFFTGNPDGVFGDNTLRAVLNFQQANGLTADGIVGPLTWRAITRSFAATELPTPTLRPTIKEGDTGEDVRLLQEILNALGLYNEEVSSVFGNDTKIAVIKFQELNDLEPTGIVGADTWEALSDAILSPRNSDDDLRDIDYTVLKEGDTDEAVIILQDKLKITGDYAASITGSFGPETTEAVIFYQKRNGLAPTGIVDEVTWARLFEDTALLIGPVVDRPTLKVGSTGDYVKELQQQLKALMFYDGAIDGVFGAKTETAVKAFQTNNKLTADGIVGRVTWSALIYLYSPLANCDGISDGGIKGIVIDAGHGGSDPGAVGPTITEKEYNLKISQYMANRFRELGVPFAMTRTTDETLTPTERVTRIKNAFGASEDVILVSNHINSGGGEGAEVIYALRDKPDLARKILTEIGNAGQKTRSYYQRTLPNDPTKDYYYIMRDTSPIQAVIVEYGFLDNSADALRLKQDWESYAEATVKAVMEYIGKSYTPPTSGKVVYVVKAGDTLFSIANRFNTTVDEIKSLNNLTNNNLSIGQQLIIPGTGIETPPPSGNIVYVVKAGDTLFSIANRFEVTVEAIKQLNNLTSNNLSIGQQLLIPGVSITPPELTFFTYTVVSGDSLYSIANRFNTTVDDLKQINNLTSNLLSIGQQLLVPNVVTEPEEETFVYTVVSGDSLFSIANRFNTTVDELKRINNLTSNLLSIGQQLLIPTKFTYIVVSGDTLFSIAKRFNTTVDELKRVNNLTSNSLSIGQQLIIPR